MNPSFSFRAAPHSLVGATALVVIFAMGCAAPKKEPSAAHKEDTLVPQETQRRAESNYGEQEAFMNDLSMSTSEQAGAAHERAVDRARDPDRENRKK